MLDNLNGTGAQRVTLPGILVGAIPKSSVEVVHEDLAQSLLIQGIECLPFCYKFKTLVKSATRSEPIVMRTNEFILFSYEEMIWLVR